MGLVTKKSFNKTTTGMASLIIGAATVIGVASSPVSNTRAVSDNSVPTSGTYYVDLDPLNNSGVNGTATLEVENGEVRVSILAAGLEANAEHPQHIHGFADGSNSVCPDMTQDTDQDGLIELEEGELTYGPILLPLKPFPTTTETGVVRYSETLDADMLAPIENREIVLHGATVNGEYWPTLPVACGDIVSKEAPDATVDTPEADEEEPVVVEDPVDVPIQEPSLDSGTPTAQFNALFADAVTAANQGLTEITVDLDESLAVEQTEAVDVFAINIQTAEDAFHTDISNASAQFEADIAAGVDTHVAKDRFINTLNQAKADYFNSLHQAKDRLNDTLNQSGAPTEIKNEFNNTFNSLLAEIGNEIEVIKNDFVSSL